MAEKTEAPTPRRRDEARAKGQGIGRSHEFSMGLTLGVGTLALSTLLPGVGAVITNQMKTSILTMDGHASTAQLLNAAGNAVFTSLVLVLPLACIVMIAGVGGNLVSGGLVFSPKAVRFDMSRINPLQGMKRIVDKQALVRLGLASAKLAILAFMSWQVVFSKVGTIVNSQGASAADITGTCLAAIFQLGLTITILLAVVALVDFVVQRRKASQSIKMTKDEVKREYRESEGDPFVRSARKRAARQMAFARMMDAVPTADVVVTNPTTLAVALKYDSLTMKAPRIVAKGQRLMAERIKQIARESNVPIVEDKPLARALFPKPVGAEVPAHLYRAVAKLLVLVHQARFRGRAQNAGAAGSRNWNPGQARAAADGLATQPWWSAATAAPMGGTVIDPSGADARTGTATRPDASTAARLYGGVADAIVDGVAHEETDDESWLEDAPAGEVVVDEVALAEAMADDELADLTPDEIAELETDPADAGNDEEQAR